MPRFRASRWAVALAVVAIGLLVALARDYIWLEDDFRANRFERANFANRPSHESLDKAVFLDHLAAMSANMTLEIRAGMPAAADRESAHGCAALSLPATADWTMRGRWP